MPKYLDFEGVLMGETMHSHFYKTPDILKDKKVLMVGTGNSGVDIACKAFRHVEKSLFPLEVGAYYTKVLDCKTYGYI